MVVIPIKRMNHDDNSTEASLSHEDEKTIPFLRRLRDMLTENDDAISFAPGRRQSSGKVLYGRIIVHDRVTVESKVLPRYFNHSSFASLRRQLNYFSFVRLGKGRQRESTYINESVVELDDILHLKRRPAGSSVPTNEDSLPSTPTSEMGKIVTMTGATEMNHTTYMAPVISISDISSTESHTSPRSTKRRRLNFTKHVKSNCNQTPYLADNFVSEDDEHSDKRMPPISLDLTKSDLLSADDEILAGCNALLQLAARGWH